MDKKELRRRYLALRGSQPEERLQAAGEGICSEVLRLPEIERSQTNYDICQFRRQSRITAHAYKAPDANGQNGLRAPVRCGSGHDGSVCCQRCGFACARGAYGILEPKPERPVPPEKIDCILVPGCAFGRNFHRIGYGKGYYDKYLPLAARAVTIGLCYELCLVKWLEAEEFDVPDDLIVTEKGVLRRNEHPVF